MFEQAFVEGVGRTRKSWTVLASFAGQILLVGLTVLLPLVYTDVLPSARLVGSILEPAPLAGDRRTAPEMSRTAEKAIPRQFTDAGLLTPRVIPGKAASIIDLEAPSAPSTGLSAQGVPGGTGLPGGPLHPVIGDMLQGPPSLAAPPAAPARTRLESRPLTRIVVGGNVSPPKPIRDPKPVYPPLARQARVAGVVRIEAIIGADGFVKNIHLIRGHPLLAPAAIAAVKEWRYTPTLLNGEPVEVVMQIDVNFTLSQ